MKTYNNHQLHKLRHGTIVIYTRNGSPTFHARVKIHGVSGYVKIASTKKRTASEAYAVAKTWYEEAKKERSRQTHVKDPWTPTLDFRRGLRLPRKPRSA